MANSSLILYNEADERSENLPPLVNSFGHLCNIVFCDQQKQQQICLNKTINYHSSVLD